MNINRCTKIFIKNVMLGLCNVHLSLTNHKHVLCAVKKAYGAMSPRRLARGRLPGARIHAPALTSVLSTLANDFVDYFSASLCLKRKLILMIGIKRCAINS